jgi:hypothetical protein
MELQELPTLRWLYIEPTDTYNWGVPIRSEDFGMKTIETAISVNPDGSAIVELQLPGTVSAGVHRAVVIVEEQSTVAGPGVDTPPDLLPLAFDGWPKDCEFRREDLYGDNGR